VDVTELANAYFAAIRARDGARLRELFAADAILISGGVTKVGFEAIANWYETQAFLVEPEPMLGPFIVDGNRLAVEIDLHTNLGKMAVCDVIEVNAGKIERLMIYGVPRLGD
jgi:SnoaL-like domain